MKKERKIKERKIMVKRRDHQMVRNKMNKIMVERRDDQMMMNKMISHNIRMMNWKKDHLVLKRMIQMILIIIRYMELFMELWQVPLFTSNSWP